MYFRQYKWLSMCLSGWASLIIKRRTHSTINQTNLAVCVKPRLSDYLFRRTQEDKSKRFADSRAPVALNSFEHQAAFLTFLLGGIAFMASPVLITIERVCECWCWETYSGCCSRRSHAVTPREGERGRERARGRWVEWINQQMSLLISQQHNDAITQNSDPLISPRRRSTSFLKRTGRISVTLGAESTTTVFPNSLTTGSDLLPLCLHCYSFWHHHQWDVLHIKNDS